MSPAAPARLVALALVSFACSSPPPSPAPAANEPANAPVTSSAMVSAKPAPIEPGAAATGADATPVVAAQPATMLAPGGADFGADARLLYRVLACAGTEVLPPGLDAEVVAKHCQALAKPMESYSKRYVVDAGAFFAGLRPAGLPTTVVYPFGGGDLTSALIAYPELTEVTTMSLEYAGDPRRLRTMTQAALTSNLALARSTLAGLLQKDNSTTDNLMLLQQSELPGQLTFFVVGLAANGYEPVGLRFFRLEPDGSLHYYTEDEIAGLDGTRAKKLHREYLAPNSSLAFANSELTFRPVGRPGAPLRVHRHFAANLANDVLKKDPAILLHLGQKGRISAMTKAASYLLWSPNFSSIRNYLLEHMVFMVSDATGIPPRYAEKAGFVVETYGRFSESFLPREEEMNQEFRRVWASQPYRKLPFRWGYQDAKGSWHMMVTRLPSVVPPATTDAALTAPAAGSPTAAATGTPATPTAGILATPAAGGAATGSSR